MYLIHHRYLLVWSINYRFHLLIAPSTHPRSSASTDAPHVTRARSARSRPPGSSRPCTVHAALAGASSSAGTSWPYTCSVFTFDASWTISPCQSLTQLQPVMPVMMQQSPARLRSPAFLDAPAF